MPRPNQNRVMISFYIDADDKDTIHRLAEQDGKTLAETYRAALKRGLRRTRKAES